MPFVEYVSARPFNKDRAESAPMIWFENEYYWEFFKRLGITDPDFKRDFR